MTDDNRHALLIYVMIAFALMAAAGVSALLASL